MDVHDKATRSYNMSRIRSTNTKPEIILRRLIWLCGLRGYRLRSKLPGRPDIIFGKKKLAVFVDGCFWHSCPHCSDGREPKSNTGYWTEKRRLNRERDRLSTRGLQDDGWTVLRLWEHEVNGDPISCALRVAKALGVEIVTDSLPLMPTVNENDAATHDPMAALREEFDRELAVLRQPDAAQKLQKAFDSTPAEIAKAANAYARRDRKP
jgi:DNA mismatch endonuclease, patch repair protein